MLKYQCAGCLFFEAFDPKHESYGLCRRYAPRPGRESPAAETTADYNPQWAQWPVVADDDWCGDWLKPRTQQGADHA